MLGKRIMTLKEVSKYLSLSESEIRILVYAKKIPFFKVGNRYRFDLESVNNWIELSTKKEGKNILYD